MGSTPYFYDGWLGDYCYECTEDSHCDYGYDCDTGTFGSYTCTPGPSFTCVSEMPSQDTDSVLYGDKYFVRLKSVTLFKHVSEVGEVREYYFWSETSNGDSQETDIPCLTHIPLEEKLSVNTKAAAVACGESFRFGIWEDDSLTDGGVLSWLFDDVVGDKWFSTLDFTESSTYRYVSETGEFELECEGCHTFCSEENSLVHNVVFPDNPEYSFDAEHTGVFPLNIWNYDQDSNSAVEEQTYSAVGLTFGCKSCYLAASDAELYIDITMSENAGFQEIFVWGEVDLMAHIGLFLESTSDTQETEEWPVKTLLPMTKVPGLGLGIPIYLGNYGIDFWAGMQVGLDLVAKLAVDGSGTSEYTTKITGVTRLGYVYNVNDGIRFVGDRESSNELLKFDNSMQATTVSTLALRPIYQVGIWSEIGVAEGHAFVQASVDYFAKAQVDHKTSGYTAADEFSEDFLAAPVKFEEFLDDTFGFVSCSDEEHDTRLLITTGIERFQLMAEWKAGLTWDGVDLKGFVWQETFGPWNFPSFLISQPLASGCTCLSCDLLDTTLALPEPDSGDEESPDTGDTSSLDPSLPNFGDFLTGIIALSNMELFEWTPSAEQIFRAALSESAQVVINHVTVEGVSKQSTISSRRRLVQTQSTINSLHVQYSIYVAVESSVSVVSARILIDIENGNFLASLRSKGLTQATYVTNVQSPTHTSISAAARMINYLALHVAMLSVYLQMTLADSG